MNKNKKGTGHGSGNKNHALNEPLINKDPLHDSEHENSNWGAINSDFSAMAYSGEQPESQQTKIKGQAAAALVDESQMDMPTYA